jgi:hypothetical protein
MDPQQFDALTRHLISASAGSRRRVLTALVAGAFGRLLVPQRIDEVAASCSAFNVQCAANSSCCPDSGLRCRDGRCRCKKGWKRCTGVGIGCQNLNTDENNCGECGNACPTGCCVKGKCREQCGDTCCEDCFVPVMSNGVPDEDNPICCKSSGGTICEHKKSGPGDDRCCYDDEVCLKGKCCCDGCEGAVKCGGKCCAIAACCNGKCCEKGYVCATKEEGDPKQTCVRANRDCDDDQACFPGETCLGGTCCSGPRECEDANGDPFCCGASRYCQSPGGPDVTCCPINTSCNSTYRGHRVRR